MTCTRCESTGFLNIEQVPETVSEKGWEAVLSWLATPAGQSSDVQICDCCGNGESWHGEPGQHYTAQDPSGKNGPYTYNGGLAECH